MKSSAHIITGKRFAIDKRVWLTLTLVLVAGGGALAWILTRTTTCVPMSLEVTGTAVESRNTFPSAAVISFKAVTQGNGTISWQFGDNTAAVQGNTVFHAYPREGDYLVIADAGNGCTESVLVHIKSMQPAGGAIAIAGDPIVGPAQLEVGMPGNFTTAATGNPEWQILNQPSFPAQYTKTATYSFQNPGTYTLQLKLGDRSFTRSISVVQTVKPLPAGGRAPGAAPAPMPAGSKAPPRSVAENYDEDAGAEPAGAESGGGSVVIADQAFKLLLNEAIRGRKDRQSFNEYLCSGGKTRVSENGSWTSFDAFFQKIYNNKRYEVKSVEAVRDTKNCIINLKVSCRHKNILGF